jgi:hypothetical protein
MRWLCLVAMLTACASPSANMKLCDAMVAARARGDYDRTPETPEALEAHHRACDISCDESYANEDFLHGKTRCLEKWMPLAELHGAESDRAAASIRTECELIEDPIACKWATDHKALYDEELAIFDEKKRNRDAEEEAERSERRRAVEKSEAEHSGPSDTGDPIDQVLARADRDLTAEGYEIVDTIDRTVSGGAVTFAYSTQLTDRFVQVVCAARGNFHATARSADATAEFDGVSSGIDGAYVEHFAVPVDVDHANHDFSVVPGWGTPARLACRVFKK